MTAPVVVTLPVGVQRMRFTNLSEGVNVDFVTLFAGSFDDVVTVQPIANDGPDIDDSVNAADFLPLRSRCRGTIETGTGNHSRLTEIVSLELQQWLEGLIPPEFFRSFDSRLSGFERGCRYRKPDTTIRGGLHPRCVALPSRTTSTLIGVLDQVTHQWHLHGRHFLIHAPILRFRLIGRDSVSLLRRCVKFRYTQNGGWQGWWRLWQAFGPWFALSGPRNQSF